MELVELLESDHQAVVEQALQAVLGYSDDPEGIALLRDLPRQLPDVVPRVARHGRAGVVDGVDLAHDGRRVRGRRLEVPAHGLDARA